MQNGTKSYQNRRERWTQRTGCKARASLGNMERERRNFLLQRRCRRERERGEDPDAAAVGREGEKFGLGKEEEKEIRRERNNSKGARRKNKPKEELYSSWE